MTVTIQLAVTGIAMGMVYALMAMGLILLIRAVNVMNFAQGDLLMLGAYIAWALTNQAGLPFYLMVPVAILSFALVGIVFMLLVYWPLRNATYPVATVIATMGASIVIKEVVTLIWGSTPLRADLVVPGVLKIGDAILQYQYLIIILVSSIIMILVYVLFEKLYAGRMMQAAAQDSYSAELLGIPTIITTMVTYIIVVILASAGGYLTAPLFMVNMSLGSMQLKAFAGCVIGGFGNIKGAIIGSLIVGIVEAYSSLFTTTYKDAVVFLVLILVLLIRPQGLMGENVADKA